MISQTEGQIDSPSRIPSTDRIPHILHYIYLSGYDAFTEETQKPQAKMMKWQFDSCVEAHPHWEVKFWTQAMADELLEQHYPWFLPVWQAYEREVSHVLPPKLLLPNVSHRIEVLVNLQVLTRPMPPLQADMLH